MMQKLLRFLKGRANGFLAGAFVPLASVAGSKKLEQLYINQADLVTYINSLFKIAISVGAFLAIIRLGIAGYMYMGGDMWTTKEKSKEMIRDVFFGLLLLLSIWIILHQINPNLLNLKINFPNALVTTPDTTPSADRGGQGALDKILADEDRVRGILQASGIEINRGGVAGGIRCLTINQIECTNVGLLGINAVTGLQRLKANCRCSITVSGGTEWFLHGENTSHGPGNSVVDLAKGGALETYIKNNKTGLGKDSKGRTLYFLDGGRFLDEDYKHWHVSY